MKEFRMPSLGADMERGTLVAWNVKPGDRVQRGQIIAVVETDKGAFDTECFEDGIIDRLLIEPGTKVPVGTPLATIRGEGETSAPLPPVAAPAPPPQAAPPVVPVSVEKPVAHVRASPLARKLAAELGVDLATVKGSGPGGVIERIDVEGAAAQKTGPSPAPAVPAEDAHAGMRRAIATAMSRSNREIPHYYLQTRIDMTRPLHWLELENAKRTIENRLLPAVLTLKAVVLALREVPDLNGFWINDEFQPQQSIHVGFAVSLRKGGLVTPAIHETDKKSLNELMTAMRDVIDRTRAGRLRASEMSDPTITLTSLGDLGVETVFGVIYPPQVALVGLGRITEQPWAENGGVSARPVLSASLAADHRASDGVRGAQFLDALNRHLQNPDKL